MGECMCVFSYLLNTYISRVPDQNGISQACYLVEIYHSGPRPSIFVRSTLFCYTQ